MGQKKYSLKQAVIFLAIVAAVGIPLEIMVINELFASSAARAERSQYDTEVSIQLTDSELQVMDSVCLVTYGQNIDCGVVRGVCLSWEIRKLRTLGGYPPYEHYDPFQLCEDGRWSKALFLLKADARERIMSIWTQDFIEGTAPLETECDYIDNNLDGRIDENFNFYSDPLNCGYCGAACEIGQSCNEGICGKPRRLSDGWTCIPRPEVCNGVDDNCNNKIDEDCPGGGQLVDAEHINVRLPLSEEIKR